MIKLKTKEDIAILREGGRRHAAIMKALVKMVQPGLTTIELDEATVRFIGEFDRDPKTGNSDGDKSAILGYKPYGASRPYPASICVSVNDEVVHGIPTENSRILEEGDIVSLDFALTHRGLVTDMAVTVPVGKIDPELARLIETTERALMAGIKAAKGGKRVGDISVAVELVGRGGGDNSSVSGKGGGLVNDGLGYGIVEDLVGHGVGYGVHEDPYVPNYIAGVRSSDGGGSGNGGRSRTANRKGDVLKPGLVIAIEPMFNLGGKEVTIDPDGYTIRTADGSPSAHFEHTVLITKGNAEILTAL
jgi:methionyl aminopeptidase